MKLRRIGATSAALAMGLTALVVAPANAGVDNIYGTNGCAGTIINNSTHGRTQPSVGQCGWMHVQLELQAHSGGHIFWTAWKKSVNTNTTVRYDKPQQTTMMKSRHAVQSFWSEKNLAL